MEKVSRARSSLVSKKMRLRLESLHVPRAAQQHAHPMPPKAHCPHADSRPCRQGARDCGPSPGSPSPVVLHDLRACPGTGLECVSSGAWGQGSLEAFLLVLALLGRTHAVGKVGTLGNLETSLGLLARPRGRRQETKTAGGGWAYHHCRDLPLWAGQAWLSCHTYMEGCTLPTSGVAARTGVCREHWYGVSEPSMGIPGPYWGGGQYWRIRIHFFCCFLLLFLTWKEAGVKPCLGSSNELSYSFGWFLAHPTIIWQPGELD